MCNAQSLESPLLVYTFLISWNGRLHKAKSLCWLDWQSLQSAGVNFPTTFLTIIIIVMLCYDILFIYASLLFLYMWIPSIIIEARAFKLGICIRIKRPHVVYWKAKYYIIRNKPSSQIIEPWLSSCSHG